MSILTDLCAIRQNKNKKHFRRYCIQCFGSGKMLIDHKEVCLKIYGKQSVKFTLTQNLY